MRNLFNLKNLLSSIHNGNFVNGLTNYGIIGALLALDVFGLVLAFKASVVLGLITLISGPAFIVSMFTLGKHYGYNFWNKAMPMVSEISGWVYYMVLGGMANAMATKLMVGVNPILATVVSIIIMLTLALWLFKYVKASLYETTFMVFVALSQLGFIFGIMEWWISSNLPHVLVSIFS